MQLSDGDDRPQQPAADWEPWRRLRKPVELRALESCRAAREAGSTQGLQYFTARTPSAFHCSSCYVSISPNTAHVSKQVICNRSLPPQTNFFRCPVGAPPLAWSTSLLDCLLLGQTSLLVSTAVVWLFVLDLPRCPECSLTYLRHSLSSRCLIY